MLVQLTEHFNSLKKVEKLILGGNIAGIYAGKPQYHEHHTKDERKPQMIFFKDIYPYASDSYAEYIYIFTDHWNILR